MSTPSSSVVKPGLAKASSAFLTVPELAELLHVNEKKIYQLAGCGQIPGTKVTGKWIFPLRLVEDWLVENSHGGVLHDRLLIGGSEDRLIHQLSAAVAIDWQHHSLISYSPSGTRHGLTMLDTGRLDACFINWGSSERTARRHMGLLRGYRNHSSWVIVRCLLRSQGLLLNPGAYEKLSLKNNATPIDSVLNANLFWAMRQSDSGAARFLGDLCESRGMQMAHLSASQHCNSEYEAVAAVNTEKAEICCGVQSRAMEFGLIYIPVADVALDLVMTRKTYFRSLMQEFLARIQDVNAQDQAQQLGGYKVLSKARLVTLEL